MNTYSVIFLILAIVCVALLSFSIVLSVRAAQDKPIWDDTEDVWAWVACFVTFGVVVVMLTNGLVASPEQYTGAEYDVVRMASDLEAQGITVHYSTAKLSDDCGDGILEVDGNLFTGPRSTWTFTRNDNKRTSATFEDLSQYEIVQPKD